MQGHLRSILPQRGGVAPVDNNTVALFPYDEHARDAITNKRPLGNQTGVRFNGTSSFIEAQKFETAGLSQISFAFWVNPSSWSSHRALLAGRSGTSNGFLVFVLSGTSLTFDFGGALQRWDTGYLPPLNRWTHIAYTHDGTVGRLYVDGAERNNTTLGSFSDLKVASGFRIGADTAVNQYHFHGQLENVSIYDKALSPQQVQFAMYEPPVATIGHWQLNEGTDRIAYDTSPYGNDGVIEGGVQWAEGMASYTLTKALAPESSGVLIEEGTTNLAASVAYQVYAYAKLEGTLDMSNPHKREAVYRYSRTTETGAARGMKILPAAAGKLYTMSIVMKVKEGLRRFVSPAKSYPESGNSISVSTIESTEEHLGDGWVKVVETYSIDSNTTTECVFCFGLSDGVIGDEFYAYDLQWEEKPYATSFVDGTRKEARLVYPSSLVEYSQGTINLWHFKKKPQRAIVSQVTSPKLLQIGEYYSNSSLTLWDMNSTAGSRSVLGLYLKGIASTGWSAAAGLYALTAGEWNMITLSWTGRVYNLYVNGVRRGGMTSNEDMGPFQGGKLYVGGNGAGGQQTELATAIFDELRIDKVERSATEIMAWYHQGRQGR